MNLVALGLSRATVPVEVRERLALSPGKVRSALRSLPPGIDQAVILCTDDRIEVYSAVLDPDQAEADLKGLLAAQHGLPPDRFASHCYYLRGAEAIRHLFRVVCGTDSAVSVAGKVQGQVRRALGQARAAGAARRPLTTLFHRAVEASQRLKAEAVQNGPEDGRWKATRAEAIVEEEVERAIAGWHSQQAAATIVSLRRRAEAVRQQELAEALRKLPSLTPEQRQAVEALSRAIVNKVLHQPTSRLRHSGDHIAAVEQLFGPGKGG